MFAKLNRITWKAGLLAVGKALLSVSIVLAASGGLDPTFSGDGKQTTHVDIAHPTWDNRAFAVAIQPIDGKIVAVGWDTDFTTNSNFAIARYNTNGSLDPTFSGDGRLITDLGGWDRAFGVAIQPNGKIVVVGDKCTNSSANVCNLAVVRYNSNGTFDTTFSGIGWRVLGFAGASTFASGGVAIQSNGKIVLGATTTTSTESDLAVFRLNANGSLDTTFNGSGRQRVSFSTGTFSKGPGDAAGWGHDVVIQTDGKIVMSGGDGKDFALLRLNSNGSLDTTFSGDGKQTTDFGANDYSWAVALQTDGKIVAVGNKDTGTAQYFAVARYTPSGALDTTFGGTGKRLIAFSATPKDTAFGVGIQSNGDIVIAGVAREIHNGDFALARLKPNGALDTTFSGDGRATYDFNTGTDVCRGMALDSSGRYVLAGLATVSGQVVFGVLRVLP